MKNPKVLLAIFALFFLVLAVFSIITYNYNNEWKNGNPILIRANKVLYKSERVLSLLKDVETGTRGFVISGDSIFLQSYTQSKDSIQKSIADLIMLTNGDVGQKKTMDRLASLAAVRLKICEDVESARGSNNYELEDIKLLLVNGKKVMDNIRVEITKLQHDETNLLMEREQANKDNTKNTESGMLILLGGLLFLLIVAFLAAQYFSKLRKTDSNALTQLNSKLIFFTKQMDDIVKGISDPFFALDKKFNFIFLNDAVKNTIGLGKGDLIGKNFFETFPQYKTTTTGIRIQEIMESKQSASFEAYEDFLDQWQDISIYPTSEGISVTIKDASKRKNYEKEINNMKKFLEETSHVAKVGGWEMDVIKNTVMWSSVAKLIHETENDYMPDFKKGFLFYKEGESRDTIMQLLNNAIENGEPWDTELQIITAKGNEKWIRTKGKAEFEGGECVRIFGIFQDISHADWNNKN
ncbi:MAG: CHASE3 domain-containing protein [Ferruginibacter sp.]